MMVMMAIMLMNIILIFFPFSLAGVLCLFSLLCALILAFFDKRAERILNRVENGTGEKVNIKDVLYFPVNFWILCIICVTYYVAIFPFISFGR